jgi:integrase/recombinase XerD
MPLPASRHADPFSRVCKPLPTSLAAGVDTTVIALWLGHESVATTQIYIHADLAIKEKHSPEQRRSTSKPDATSIPAALVEFLESL